MHGMGYYLVHGGSQLDFYLVGVMCVVHPHRLNQVLDFEIAIVGQHGPVIDAAALKVENCVY